jgi:hypothetical protein
MNAITERQLDYIEILANKWGRPIAVVLGEAYIRGVLEYSYDHLNELDRSEASKIIEWLKEETE